MLKAINLSCFWGLKEKLIPETDFSLNLFFQNEEINRPKANIPTLPISSIMIIYKLLIFSIIKIHLSKMFFG